MEAQRRLRGVGLATPGVWTQERPARVRHGRDGSKRRSRLSVQVLVRSRQHIQIGGGSNLRSHEDTDSQTKFQATHSYGPVHARPNQQTAAGVVEMTLPS